MKDIKTKWIVLAVLIVAIGIYFLPSDQRAAYMATIYGTLLWIAIEFVREKDSNDDQEKTIDWSDYKKKHWDNWLLAILGIPFVVHWGPDATKLFFDLEWSSFGYGMSGFIVQALYWKYKKYRNENKQ